MGYSLEFELFQEIELFHSASKYSVNNVQLVFRRESFEKSLIGVKVHQITSEILSFISGRLKTFGVSITKLNS